jgi:hypothetical protein
MSRITNKGATSPLSLFQTSNDMSFNTFAGERFDLSDGREVVLVQAGAVALGNGVLVQATPLVADFQNLVVTAYSAGASSTPTRVTVTLGATAATANQFAGGFLVVNDNAGEGQTLKIASHPAALATASLVVTLEDTPVTAITTASEVCLQPNPYAAVVINPTTATSTPLGASFYPIAASTATVPSFGYLISKGPTAVLADGAVGVGAAISPSNAVAGAVESGVIAQGFVGRALQAGVDTEYRTVYLDC